jgi:hypothetical protein
MLTTTLREMPFIPENYPPNWKAEIVPRIRARDGNKCTRCGVPDRAVGYWSAGTFEQLRVDEQGRLLDGQRVPAGRKLTTIYLQTAHLDHALVDHGDENLASMCPRCHMNYDRASCDAQRQAGRKYGAKAIRKNPDQFTIGL